MGVKLSLVQTTKSLFSSGFGGMARHPGAMPWSTNFNGCFSNTRIFLSEQNIHIYTTTNNIEIITFTLVNYLGLKRGKTKVKLESILTLVSISIVAVRSFRDPTNRGRYW
jgi:hypothetical protein